MMLEGVTLVHSSTEGLIEITCSSAPTNYTVRKMRKVNRVVKYGMEEDFEEADEENRYEEVWG